MKNCHKVFFMRLSLCYIKLSISYFLRRHNKLKSVFTLLVTWYLTHLNLDSIYPLLDTSFGETVLQQTVCHQKIPSRTDPPLHRSMLIRNIERSWTDPCGIPQIINLMIEWLLQIHTD